MSMRGIVMDGYSLFAGGVGLVVVIFLVVLAILWFLLPFAVFGIKDLLKVLVSELRASRAVQMQILAELQVASAPVRPAMPQLPPSPVEAGEDDRTLAEIMATKPER